MTSQLLAAASLSSAVLLVFSGISFFVRPDSEATVRSILNQFALAFLVYAAVFTISAQIWLPYAAVVVLMLALSALGLTGLITAGIHCRRDPMLRTLLALGLLSVFLAIGSSFHPPLGPIDPINYAYGTARIFHNGWFVDNIAQLRPRGIDNLDVLVSATRASAIAYLWPITAFGMGIGPLLVYQTSAWLYFLCLAFTALLLTEFTSIPASIVIALAAVGISNIRSLVILGQINQAFVLAAVCCGIYLARQFSSGYRRDMVYALTSYLVMSGYPEFLLCLPLYFLCALLDTTTRYRDLAHAAVSAGIGVLTASIATGFYGTGYIHNQASMLSPLPSVAPKPDTLLGVWRGLTLESAQLDGLSTAYIVASSLCAAGVFVTMYRSRRDRLKPATSLVWYLAISALLLFALYGFLILHAPDANRGYRLFKLAGWLGPGLLLLLCALRRFLPLWASPVAIAGVTILTTLRLLGVQQGYTPTNAWSPDSLAVIGASFHEGGCRVEAASSLSAVYLMAISVSAAPFHGCQISTSPNERLASAYYKTAPVYWKVNEVKSYVVLLKNLSGNTWEAHEPLELSVSFRSPSSPTWALPPWSPILTGPVPPGGSVSFTVASRAPARPGRYILEQRLMGSGGAASDQVDRTIVTVE